MSSESGTSADPRQRIRAAYDPELLRAAGHRLVDLLAEHLSRVQSCGDAVLNWREPPENVEDAYRRTDAFPDAAPAPQALAEHFAELVRLMLSRGLNLHDPRYIGHQVPASVPLAGLFDAVGSVTNQVMAIYEMGPWASAVERAMVERLGEQIGWKRGDFSGLITHGGSLANTTALLTARNVSLGDAWERGVASAGGRDHPASRRRKPAGTNPEAHASGSRGQADPSGTPGNSLPRSANATPVLVAHAEAHYCIARSAGILGLGTGNVIRAELDDRRRIDPNRLDETLRRLRAENRPIVAVVACACATPVGAFDPLGEIAEVCRRHEVWLHVDAAHGGAACFSGKYRHLLAGLDRADSLIWDAHKMLFVPALCAFVFYRNKEHRFEAFRQDAPYLFDPSAPGLADYDSGLKTVECTKRAAAYGLWGVWSLFGPRLFADMVEVTFDLGRLFYEKLQAASDFQPLHEPQCNIVVFRHVPEKLRDAPPERLGAFQLDLRRELIRSGEFYIVPTKVHGTGALRCTIINPLTEERHLEELMHNLRARGRRLLQKQG